MVAAGCLALFVLLQAGWAVSLSPLVFVRDGNLWRMDTSGGSQQRLTTSGDCSAPSWSPDGARVVYVRTNERRQSLWVLNVHADTAAQFVGTVSQYMSPRWSPDGKSVACFRVDAAHAGVAQFDPYQLLKIDVASQAVTVLQGAITGPASIAWSPDSMQIAYSAGVEGTARINVVAAADGKMVHADVAKLSADTPEAVIGSLNWLPAGKIIYTTDVAEVDDRAVQVCEVTLAGPSQTLYTQSTEYTGIMPWGVSADSAGRMFLCWQASLGLLAGDKVTKLADNVSEATSR
jgi:hypothetical protein